MFNNIFANLAKLGYFSLLFNQNQDVRLMLLIVIVRLLFWFNNCTYESIFLYLAIELLQMLTNN